MKRYILIWDVANDYNMNPEMERFEEEKQLHERVNELAALYKNNLIIILSAYINREYKYDPVEAVTKYIPKVI